jgi:hypothetical protein
VPGHHVGPADAVRAHPGVRAADVRSPVHGNYGQDGSNDPRIADDLLGWLSLRFDAVFTQDVNARARPGSGQPLGRLQISTGDELYEMLLAGE